LRPTLSKATSVPRPTRRVREAASGSRVGPSQRPARRRRSCHPREARFGLCRHRSRISGARFEPPRASTGSAVTSGELGPGGGALAALGRDGSVSRCAERASARSLKPTAGSTENRNQRARGEASKPPTAWSSPHTTVRRHGGCGVLRRPSDGDGGAIVGDEGARVEVEDMARRQRRCPIPADVGRHDGGRLSLRVRRVRFRGRSRPGLDGRGPRLAPDHGRRHRRTPWPSTAGAGELPWA